MEIKELILNLQNQDYKILELVNKLATELRDSNTRITKLEEQLVTLIDVKAMASDVPY